MLTSLVLGLTLLVTHLERRPFPHRLEPVLYKEKRVVADQTVVVVGGVSYPWHADFLMFLSSATPLFLHGESKAINCFESTNRSLSFEGCRINAPIIVAQYLAFIRVSLAGAGFYGMPVRHMCVVDLTTSQEGVMQLVLSDVMAVERPEFAAQKHSSEGDTRQHQMALRAEQVSLIHASYNN